MLPSVARLIGRIWTNLLSQLGTTTTAVVVFSFLLPILGFALALVGKILEGRKSGLAMAQIIKNSILSWPTVVAASLPVIAWLGLFGWISVRTVYQEHGLLVSDNAALKLKVEGLEHKNAELEQKLAVAPAQPHKTASSVPSRKSSLASLTDGQRFSLKQSFGKLAGNSIRIVRMGSSPESVVTYEQLVSVFEKWNVQPAIVGEGTVVGANSPSVSYLTGPDMSSTLLRNVYTVFDSVGVDLRLTPDAFMGPLSLGPPPPVVIVIR